MGCDIHTHAEVKVNGVWQKVSNKPFVNPYYREGEENKIDADGYEWNPKFTDTPYDGRNYDLFAILADVRNGRGSGGIKTGEGFNPIAEPKGLPNDVSAEVKKHSDDWYGDGHSHSYFTVKELKDYDWGQITMKRGSISLSEYKRIKESGVSPDSWSGSISGGNIETVDEQTADRLLKGETIEELTGKQIWVNYHWSILYSDHAKFFLEDTMPTLEKLGKPEDVRIVFWFDN